MFRKPLVPARWEAEAGGPDRNHRAPAVAGPEVAVFVVARERRNVDLASAGQDLTARRDANRRLVAETLVLRPLIEGGVDPGPVSAAIRAANRVVGPSGIDSARRFASSTASGVIAK